MSQGQAARPELAQRTREPQCYLGVLGSSVTAESGGVADHVVDRTLGHLPRDAVALDGEWAFATSVLDVGEI